MLIRIFKILLPLLFCAQVACDNAKNNAAKDGNLEPALSSFRKVTLDSSLIANTTEELNSEVKAEVPKLTPEPKPKEKKRPSAPKPKKKKAVIVFDSLIYHLPDMIEGDRASLELKFVNEGDAPLSIKEVDVVCGCTTPEVPFLDILPGEEGKIGIQYNSVGKDGLQEPEITVISNGIPRKTVLKIIVNVSSKEKIEKDSSALKPLQDSLPD